MYKVVEDNIINYCGVVRAQAIKSKGKECISRDIAEISESFMELIKIYNRSNLQR